MGELNAAIIGRNDISGMQLVLDRGYRVGNEMILAFTWKVTFLQRRPFVDFGGKKGN
jgi:hypothetical protein